jgi:hypothetical protein
VARPATTTKACRAPRAKTIAKSGGGRATHRSRRTIEVGTAIDAARPVVTSEVQTVVDAIRRGVASEVQTVVDATRRVVTEVQTVVDATRRGVTSEVQTVIDEVRLVATIDVALLGARVRSERRRHRGRIAIAALRAHAVMRRSGAGKGAPSESAPARPPLENVARREAVATSDADPARNATRCDGKHVASRAHHQARSALLGCAHA